MTRVSLGSVDATPVHVVSLGCARNEVDSEELAGRLAAGGWLLVDDAARADVAVINTCGFVQQAKKDSIDALLEASDLKGTGRTQKVVAVGCLAERYGEQLAAELQLPVADLVDALRPVLHAAADDSHVVVLSSWVLAYVAREIPEANLWVAAIDEKLDEHAYIVPGLGDAGDRIFGTK